MSNDIWKMRSTGVSSFLVLAAVLFLTFVIAACNNPTKSSPVFTVEHEITPQPVRVGPATIKLRLSDANRQPVIGAGITLEGNMSHAGMGPVSVQAREMEPGRYQAILELSMAGDWIILTHITLRDGQKVERELEVKGVRPN